MRCFDNIKLERRGEYFIRGFVESNAESGLFEPLNECESDDFVTATGLVGINHRNLIPIRIWTTNDKVHLSKGMVIGTFQPVQEYSDDKCDKVALISGNENDERWKI